ncbi:hypothetical protein HD598_001070 [Neomicrococcus aestuarii]|uniref:Uncharacterized protein n=1 Tax=Neomicrococcus aestuarii TaxID=556325 RepID=A0A7W8TUQ3_9MICC|nr:hypothetical protein [Neomicrococcus aestuarii]MBB5512383.1 hypothetical protein [Neomicrococcus aestuarii]
MARGIFGTWRANRREAKELGNGVWRRAHDRYVRALDRFHQILEQEAFTEENAEFHNAMVSLANECVDVLPSVRAICVRAQELWPSEENNIPGPGVEIHRELSHTANDLAQAAQALAMAFLQKSSGVVVLDPQESAESGPAASVRRRVAAVTDGVERAEAKLAAVA